MKILYINALDKRYGSTYRSRNIVKALIELGHDVTYVESNSDDKIFINCINVTQKDNFLGYLRSTYQRALLTYSLDYDILFLQKFIPLTVPSLIIGKLKRKKCIVDWDDLDFVFQENVFKKTIVFLCEHFFSYFADYITTHSQKLKKYALQLGIRDVEIINQVVDFEEFNISEEEKEKLREQIGAKNKRILCFLGTLTSGGARDLDVIIKVVSSVIAKENNIFFLIIGGGPLEDKFFNMLRQFRLASNSYITGIIPQQETRKYLNIADIGLVYMRDNYGNMMRVSFKVLEYLALGIPVVGHLTGESNDRFSSFCSTAACEAEFIENIIELLNSRIAKKQFSLREYSLSNTKESLNTVLNSHYL